MNTREGRTRPGGAGRSEETAVPASAFRERLERLLEEADARRADRGRAARAEMETLEAGLASFDALACRWMDQIIAPQLETLAVLFPHGLGVRRSPAGSHAWLAFAFTDEFPADARVEVSLDPDVPRKRLRVRVSPSILPMLTDYRGEAEMEFDLGSPDDRRLVEFLEQAVLEFVSAYLKVREPDSVYQRDRLATDPVCGMRFPRGEAAASYEYERRTFFFCSAGCRERFATDPGRHGSGLPGGTTGGSRGIRA
jgi:YHS domain-containing protein